MHALLVEAWKAQSIWDNSGAGNFLTPDDSASSENVQDSSEDSSENVPLAQLANEYANPPLNPPGNVRQPQATGIELHAVAVKYSKARYSAWFDD